jgi:hypothetical protein
MLAVTTRNKLRSSRFCLPMMRARRSISEQLSRTPGLIRYVSAIASPTEFLTLTVWENRQAMFNFMNSDAHRRFMWMFTRWSDSFWSMRWVPTTIEEGTWEKLSLSSMVGPDGQLLSAALPKAPPLPLPEQPKRRVPGSRVVDPSGSGVYIITALVEAASPGRLWALLRTVEELRRQGEADHSLLLRWSVGVVRPPRFLVLSLWHDSPQGPVDALDVLRQRLHTSWIMCWTAGEYEIGHWNGLRLRQLASARSRQQRMKPEAIEQVGPDMH